MSNICHGSLQSFLISMLLSKESVYLKRFFMSRSLYLNSIYKKADLNTAIEFARFLHDHTGVTYIRKQYNSLQQNISQRIYGNFTKLEKIGHSILLIDLIGLLDTVFHDGGSDQYCTILYNPAAGIERLLKQAISLNDIKGLECIGNNIVHIFDPPIAGTLNDVTQGIKIIEEQNGAFIYFNKDNPCIGQLHLENIRYKYAKSIRGINIDELYGVAYSAGNFDILVKTLSLLKSKFDDSVNEYIFFRPLALLGINPINIQARSITQHIKDLKANKIFAEEGHKELEKIKTAIYKLKKNPHSCLSNIPYSYSLKPVIREVCNTRYSILQKMLEFLNLRNLRHVVISIIDVDSEEGPFYNKNQYFGFDVSYIFVTKNLSKSDKVRVIKHELNHAFNDLVFENRAKPFYAKDKIAHEAYKKLQQETILNIGKFFNISKSDPKDIRTDMVLLCPELPSNKSADEAERMMDFIMRPQHHFEDELMPRFIEFPEQEWLSPVKSFWMEHIDPHITLAIECMKNSQEKSLSKIMVCTSDGRKILNNTFNSLKKITLYDIQCTESAICSTRYNNYHHHKEETTICQVQNYCLIVQNINEYSPDNYEMQLTENCISFLGAQSQEENLLDK